MKLKRVTTLTITEEEQNALGELLDLVDDENDVYSLLSGLYNGDISQFGIELIVKLR